VALGTPSAHHGQDGLSHCIPDPGQSPCARASRRDPALEPQSSFPIDKKTGA